MSRVKLAVVAVTVVGAACIGYGFADAATPAAAHNGQHGPVGAQPRAGLDVIPPTIATAVFVPITPCRIADTRLGGGLIANAATRTFQVTGSSGFSGQGGKSSGCNVPASAKSVALTATAVGATNHGYVTLYPSGASKPVSTALSFTKTATISGAADATIGTSGQIRAYVGGSGATDLILDVNGYYSPVIQARINSGGGIYSGTAPVLTAAHLGTGYYQVTTDRDLTGCNAVATASGGNYYVAAYTSGTSVYADTYNASGAATDIYWSVVVDC